MDNKVLQVTIITDKGIIGHFAVITSLLYGRHRSLVVEPSPLVHEVRGSKSDSEIWVTFNFGTDKLSPFTQQWMGTWHSLELGKVKRGTGHPTSSCRVLQCASLYKAHPLSYAIIINVYSMWYLCLTNVLNEWPCSRRYSPWSKIPLKRICIEHIIGCNHRVLYTTLFISLIRVCRLKNV